ncbi:hypothetical protein V1514DRAFT_326116 [Lipomyces japonicus]|uniref:uncharacterized protein n=1 Tax=Lipomyces japonicus TaxID=56871 RepID=UPI0034CEA64F
MSDLHVLPDSELAEELRIVDSFERFKTIRSAPVRQHLLNALFANLLPSDIWHLTNLLGERQLFVDVIGLLPSELLIIVLSSCSAREVLSWRRVSKRWNQRLSEEFICSQLLRQEFKDEVPSQRPQDAVLSSKSDQLQQCTFRSIAIKQSTRLGTRKELSDLRPQAIAYWGGRLVVSGVMLGSELKHTMLYELFSDKRWILQKSRESWYNLTCSETICGGVTSLGKCKIWNLRDPTTCQERQLLSSNTREIASSKNIVAVITMDTDIMVWHTETNDELSTSDVTAYMRHHGLTLYHVGLHADRELIILLASKSIKNDVESQLLIFDFDQNLVFRTELQFAIDTRLYRPLQPDLMYVTCSGIRMLTKIDLKSFTISKFGGFVTSGESLIGVPFRDSVFLLEGSYLTRLTVTSYSSAESKWSYYGILFSLDQTSKMFDLQGDGHYVCARMDNGVLVFSFNLYDYLVGGKNSGVIDY